MLQVVIVMPLYGARTDDWDEYWPCKFKRTDIYKVYCKSVHEDTV